MKILLLDGITDTGRELMESIPNIEIVEGNISVAESIEIKAVYTHFTYVNLRLLPQLKYVLCPCTNYSHLKIPDDADLNIFYLDDKRYLNEKVWSTAEHTVYLMSTLTRRLNREIRGSTVGYIGYGRVARQVSQLLKGFHVDEIRYDKEQFGGSIWDINSTKISYLDNLREVFENSDIITIHLSETEETKGLISLDILDYCGKKPIIINTARASILDPRALLLAYRANIVSGFGLDVTEGYSNIVMSGLHDCPNGIITPHIAGKSTKSRIATDHYVIQKLKEALNGKVNT